MNILIMNWRDPKNPYAGGAEIVTLEHAKAWVRGGHSVTWISPTFKSSREEEVINGVRIVRKGNFLTIYIRAILFYLFSGNKFDLVIDEIHGIPFFTPFYVRKPKIAFIHEVAGKIFNYMLPFPISRLLIFLEPYIFKIYRNVEFITVSDSTKKELESFGIKKMNLIRNGIFVKKVGNIKKEENPTFIFLNRIVKMKGIEDVFAAFKIILEKENKAKLWIVGKGNSDYVKKLKKQTKKLDINKNVVFFGRVDNLTKYKLFRKAHILLHPSIKEGWGLVVIEAASQGTPSVVYDVAGLRDSVRHNSTGIVLSNNNPEEMAEEALLLLRDKERYRQFSSNCLKWAKSMNWDDATEHSLKIINKYEKNKD